MASKKNSNLSKSSSPQVKISSAPTPIPVTSRPLNDYSAKELSSIRKDSLVSLIIRSRLGSAESAPSSPAPQPDLQSDPPLSCLHASDLKTLIANSVSEALSSFTERLDSIESRLSQLEANYSKLDSKLDSKFQHLQKDHPPSDSSIQSVHDLHVTIAAEVRRENERRTKEKT